MPAWNQYRDCPSYFDLSNLPRFYGLKPPTSELRAHNFNYFTTRLARYSSFKWFVIRHYIVGKSLWSLVVGVQLRGSGFSRCFFTSLIWLWCIMPSLGTAPQNKSRLALKVKKLGTILCISKYLRIHNIVPCIWCIGTFFVDKVTY